MSAAPKITALAPWFGGKRTLAEEIVREFGPHRAYWELCCGSMAVLFSKEPASMETAIDLHGDLTNLAFVLIEEDMAAELYGRLARTIHSREVWRRSADVICDQPAPRNGDPPDAERAYHYFVFSWIGRNGMAGTRSSNTGFSARYTKNGGHSGRRFVSAVESIPEWHHRLRPVTVTRADIFAELPRIEDADGVLIYIDPPYLKKGAKYVHDFDQQFNEFADGRVAPVDHTFMLEPGEPWPKLLTAHEYLAKLLRRFKRTRVVVSYYDDPQLASLYPGWTVRHLKASKALVNQGRRDAGGAVAAPEVLLINGPSLVAPAEPAGLFTGADA